MIEPDVREVLFYDINNMLTIEPDFVPHYFSILLDKFRVLSYGNTFYKLPICNYCGSTEMTEFEGKYYCLGNYIPTYEEKDGEIVCTAVNVMNESENHQVNEEYIMAYINRVIGEIIKRLQEPNGYLMNLFVLEGYLFRQDNDDFFETVDGDIRKATVLKDLYKVKKSIIGYLSYLRGTIRFSATLKTPPIRMG